MCAATASHKENWDETDETPDVEQTGVITMSRFFFATAVSALSLVTGLVLADPMQEIVVEAAAPVNHTPTGGGPPGGASVDLLSVQYHVHLGSLDLSKHADVVALEQKVKEAAQKACQDIQKQYPARQLSDETECVDGAVKRAMGRVQNAVDAAQKKPG
jgi:UrcA family protein